MLECRGKKHSYITGIYWFTEEKVGGDKTYDGCDFSWGYARITMYILFNIFNNSLKSI